MNSFAELRALRVGCVQYLNARPLIDAYPGTVVFDHPSRLAEMLVSGDLDVALVPTFEALRCPGFRIADGVSISSRGAVYSVFMAYRGCLKDVKTVSLDPASLTSANLLRVLLAEFHGMKPNYVRGGDADARLLIGNQAICFHQKHGAEYRYLDLGQEWMERTELPFVFAVWLVRPEVPEPATVAESLRALKNLGLERVDKIATEQRDFSPEFARRYLTGHIRFDLGDAEKAGIEKFRELLIRHGLLAQENAGELQFV